MGIIKDLFVTPKMIGAWGERKIVNKLRLINLFGKNGKTHKSLVILQLKTPLFSKRSLMIIPLFTILILFVKFLCWLLLLLSKTDPVLNVTDPTAQKRGTDGRCLTLVLPASLSVLLQKNRDLVP